MSNDSLTSSAMFRTTTDCDMRGLPTSAQPRGQPPSLTGKAEVGRPIPREIRNHLHSQRRDEKLIMGHQGSRMMLSDWCWFEVSRYRIHVMAVLVDHTVLMASGDCRGYYLKTSTCTGTCTPLRWLPCTGTRSRSTRRDQGCLLVRENPGSVKR